MNDIGEDALAALKERLAGETDFIKSLNGIRAMLGVRHVVYHLQPAAAGGLTLPFVRTTYSPQWIMRYILANYVDIDPVGKRGMSSPQPFYWSELKHEAAEIEAFFRDAISHGVGNCGFTHPVGGRTRKRALFTINTDGDPHAFRKWLEPLERHVHEMARILHRRALGETCHKDVVRRLSPREIECLNWIARGKDATTIAAILQISEHTVRDYMKSARTKLDCTTIAQAVYEATRRNLIKP